jgi:hypothetical protein
VIAAEEAGILLGNQVSRFLEIHIETANLKEILNEPRTRQRPLAICAGSAYRDNSALSKRRKPTQML